MHTSEPYARVTLRDIVFGTATGGPSPSVMLRPSLDNGECWRMKGASGWFEVRLPYAVAPTNFTLDHVPSATATEADRASAPRDVTVEARVGDGWEPVARLVYDVSATAKSHIQTVAAISVCERAGERADGERARVGESEGGRGRGWVREGHGGPGGADSLCGLLTLVSSRRHE